MARTSGTTEAPCGLTPTERGRLHLILQRLERQWDRMHPFEQRHVVGLLGILADTYCRETGVRHD